MNVTEDDTPTTDSPRRRTRGKPRGRSINPESLKTVGTLLGDSPRDKDMLIEHLHRIQDSCGHLSAENLAALASEMNLPQAVVYEVASFYHHFDIVKEGATAPPSLTVRVCDSLTCSLFGAEALIGHLGQLLGPDVRVQRVPCVGRCDEAPVAVAGTFPVPHAKAEQVARTVQDGNINAVPPQCIGYRAYREAGGYRLLESLLDGQIGTDEIMGKLEDSNLRGLGGAGFPVGRKWRIVSKLPAPRLMAVNIDEGEPGTFKDRYFLERDPHRFLEGMLIASQVVGIDAIYIYLRDEYAGCRAMLQQELQTLQREKTFDCPPIELRRGAGAYICGEESAMIESIEGKRGMPRLRPPYVAEVGLFGRPTLEHNMETLYWVRDIVKRGPDWFSEQGRNGRKGLRSFSVSGRVQKPGVHIAPAGISLNQLVQEYCGGMLPGHELRAYFPGGASGGILPASMADLPLDFDTLNEHGCFIGSAAIIVLSNQDSVKQAALNAMRFFSHESCGQCTPCRVGTAKAVQLMEQPRWDQPLLRELCQTMADASICGLGQAAPNPLLCVMHYFPEELEDDSQG